MISPINLPVPLVVTDAQRTSLGIFWDNEPSFGIRIFTAVGGWRYRATKENLGTEQKITLKHDPLPNLGFNGKDAGNNRFLNDY